MITMEFYWGRRFLNQPSIHDRKSDNQAHQLFGSHSTQYLISQVTVAYSGSSTLLITELISCGNHIWTGSESISLQRSTTHGAFAAHHTKTTQAGSIQFLQINFKSFLAI